MGRASFDGGEQCVEVFFSASGLTQVFVSKEKNIEPVLIGCEDAGWIEKGLNQLAETCKAAVEFRLERTAPECDSGLDWFGCERGSEGKAKGRGRRHKTLFYLGMFGYLRTISKQ